MRIDRTKVFTAVFASFVALASATYAQAANFTIGGTVSGLTSGNSVTLLDNGGDSLKVTAIGKFTFATALATGATYSVTVGTQPTGQTCTVTGGSGTVGTVNVITVRVACKATTYTIGGTASGLITGRSVTLLDNGGGALKVTKNAAFTFKTGLVSGAAYKVTVGTQPSGETCAVTDGSGTVGTADITTVVVSCTPNKYTIGGTVSGLGSGDSITFLDNGGDSLKVTANGTFTFATPVASGAAYKVTVSVQPTGETCAVTKGTGKVVAADVTTVAVTCTVLKFTVGGSVSGLTSGDSVTLLNNGGNSLTATANGAFTFTTALDYGAAYDVTVGTQPVGETCTVTGGSGTVTKKIITVKVACKASTFSIGGALTGLTSGTVTLLDNGGNSLPLTANGTFTFTTKLATGATYSVTVGTQPAGETCTVTAGSGTVGTKNVTTAKVACAAAGTFSIGGALSGLSSGTVTLLDNGGNSLPLTANGTFTFTTKLASGATYSVTVGTQPSGQTCTVTNGSGTVGSANVTNVAVACAANPTFSVGGALSGLSSGTVTLLDNGGNSLPLTANGTFTFTTKLASGATYSVTVGTQPTGETCTVTNGSGTVGSANVTNVAVACATAATFSIGGALSGLSSGTVTLLDNGGNSLPLTANGTFTFTTKLASGATYSVTVGTQPSGQTCTVTNGSGTVGSANVTNVAVACAANPTFSVGGTLAGLSSGTVTLLDNGGNSLPLTANGTFTFTTKLASGATYSVTVGTQPSGQTCTVTNGSGTVGSANVTNVAVACAANPTFSIGGTLSGLSSGTVTLLDNGGNSLPLTANGTFTFTTKLASGATYSVTVGTQPSGQTCTVTNGSGTVGSANVTNVAVACATVATFSIGGTLSGLTSGTVTLLDNGGNSLPLTANGTFTFTTKVASGATYNVTVGTQPTSETCTVTNGSGTVGSANVTNVAVACSTGSGGGGGAYWIPYSAAPAPGATPAGSNGLFLIPSDKLSSAPAPTFVTTDTNQLIGIGTQILFTSGVLTYSPQVMMYADTASTGTTKIFGLTLAGTSSVPAPTQISNLAVPSGQVICQSGSSSGTDVTQPTTLFAVVQVGTETQCISGAGTFEVVHYLDSATTAPLVVNLNATTFNAIYQSGKLTGLLQFNSATSSLNIFADDTFTSPTQKITGIMNYSYVAGVLDAATLSTSAVFVSVTTTGGDTELYRIDGATQAATLIQNVTTGSFGDVTQDDNNLYYLVLTPGTGNATTPSIYQVALTGGTPKFLYTGPTFTENGTGNTSYQLVGSNDSVLAFEFAFEPTTSGIADPTKATATLYSLPVGTTTSTPNTLASYPAGSLLLVSFLAAPSGSGRSGGVIFAALRTDTGTISAPTYTYSAVSIPLNGGTVPAPIAHSVYLPLAVISPTLTDSVWQLTGITDTNGGFGGGTANIVNVSNLTDTPFTTVGGGDYVLPSGFTGSLFSISSNNVALGFFENSSAVAGGATLQEIGAAADLTKNFYYPVVVTNTYVAPY